jgi:hypothetical protein
LEPADDAAIENIKEEYGLAAASDAIRVAVRIVGAKSKSARVHYDPRRRKQQPEKRGSVS